MSFVDIYSCKDKPRAPPQVVKEWASNLKHSLIHDKERWEAKFTEIKNYLESNENPVRTYLLLRYFNTSGDNKEFAPPVGITFDQFKTQVAKSPVTKLIDETNHRLNKCKILVLPIKEGLLFINEVVKGVEVKIEFSTEQCKIV